MRTFVMGNIHGNAKGLHYLLSTVNFDYHNDTLIQLGDVADGWSETADCVEILLKIKNLISIRGNHDVWVNDWFQYGTTPIMWTQQGGQATIDSYIRTGFLGNRFHKDFWKDQIDWYIDEQNRLFIHAGWDYKYIPEEFHVSNLSERELFIFQANAKVNGGTTARECHWDRTIISGARSAASAKQNFKATQQFEEVFIGHTASPDGLVHQYGNLWNMDSGSGWNGRLSIMELESKTIVYAPTSKELYPNEKGR